MQVPGNKDKLNRERRYWRRIPARMNTLLCHENILYSGTVLNLSERGLLMNVKALLADDALLALSIRREREIMVSAKVKWKEKTGTRYRMGVEIAATSGDYAKLMKGRSSHHSPTKAMIKMRQGQSEDG